MRVKKVAFTLAEVLITLGIIGIVAAMTLPALTGAYRKHVVETELKKTYSLLNQLIRRSEADNESAITWDWEQTGDRQQTNEFFDKYFKPYLNIVDRKSGYGGYYKVYSSVGEGPSWAQNNANNANWVRLADGRAVMLSLWSRENVHYGTWTVIVSTGAKKDRIVSGRDLFSFAININKDKTSVSVFPNSYWNWTCKSVENQRANFISKCRELGSNTDGNYPEVYCTMLIYCNNWKIPDDYPVKL